MDAEVRNSTVTMVTWLDTVERLFVPPTEYRATAVLSMTVPGKVWARAEIGATVDPAMMTKSHAADARVLNRRAPGRV